ncbi:MAG: hypothetical protein COA79_23350 [Planctomycetota bacterium]|nr:MAG: hypothetical protein COA79_23350 [Planctomycetota bacterium]
MIFTQSFLSCTHINKKFLKEQPSTRQFSEIKLFDYKKYPPIQPKLTLAKPVETNRFVLKLYEFFHRRKYEVYKFTFPTAKVISENETTNTAYYYKPKKIKGKLPLVIVFPILSGDHTISEWQAKVLANKGFAVIRFEKKKSFLKADVKPDFHVEILKHTIIDARRALDHILTWPEIDPEKIAVTGISLGGISASLLMIADNRIKVGGFFLLGGNLSKIVTQSKERFVTKYRDELIKKVDLKDLENWLRPFYQEIDPLVYSNRLDPKNIIMFSAKLDNVIPEECSQEIWSAMGNPYWIKVPLVGHYTAFAYFFYGNKKIAKFFHSKFKLLDLK